MTGITKRFSCLNKRFNVKVVNAKTTSLKQKFMIKIMNQRNKT